MAYLDEHSFQSKLHRWRFNLKDGTTREERLDDRVLEFGMINAALRRPAISLRLFNTSRCRAGSCSDGFVKNDLKTGESWSYELGPGRYGSEAPFAPRLGRNGRR